MYKDLYPYAHITNKTTLYNEGGFLIDKDFIHKEFICQVALRGYYRQLLWLEVFRPIF